MTGSTSTPVDTLVAGPHLSLTRRLAGTTFLFILLSILTVSQVLLAYRKELEPFLNKAFKAYRPWIEFLPDYCFPMVPTSLAVLLAVTGTLILVIWRRHAFNKTIRGNAPLEVACPSEPWKHKKVVWILCPVFLVLSASGWLWAMMLTASRPRHPGEGLFEWLFLNTTGDGAAAGTGWIWLISILSGAGAFYLLDLIRGHRPRLGGEKWEWIFVASATLVCIGIYSIGLTDWRYSVVGDEYAFFFHAEMLDRLPHLPFFGEQGVYGTHPQLSSIFQLALMRLFGFSVYWWRFSSVLTAAIVLPPLYLLARLLLGKRAAVVAATLYLVSHYSFSFAHIPYNNNHAMFPVIAAMALFFLARSQASLFYLFICGLAAGLGFHTFFSGRVGLLITLFLWALWYVGPKAGELSRAASSLLAILAGFALVGLPVVRNPMSTWQLMSTQTAFAERVVGKSDTPVSIYGYQVHPESLKRLKQNVVHSLLAPLTYDARRASARHFVSGGLVDRAASAMAFLGLVQSLWWYYKRRWLTFLGGYGLTLVAVGMASPADYPLVTRMLLMVPFTILLASVGVEKVLSVVKPLWGRWSTRILLVVFLSTSAFLNGYEVFYRFPERHTNSGHALVISLLQESSPRTHVAYVLANRYPSDNVIELMGRIYGFQDRFVISRYDPSSHAVTPLPIPCLVAVYLSNPEWPWIQKYLSQWYPRSKSSILPHTLDGGIGVIEIGNTGWNPSPKREAYIPPQ